MCPGLLRGRPAAEQYSPVHEVQGPVGRLGDIRQGGTTFIAHPLHRGHWSVYPWVVMMDDSSIVKQLAYDDQVLSRGPKSLLLFECPL